MQKIELEWAGETYVIREDQAFGAVEMVEDIVSLQEVYRWQDNPKFTKMAKAFAALINYAGGNVTPEAVYSQIMADIKQGGADAPALVSGTVMALVAVLMDGAPSADEAPASADPNPSAPLSENASSPPSEAA